MKNANEIAQKAKERPKKKEKILRYKNPGELSHRANLHSVVGIQNVMIGMKIVKPLDRWSMKKVLMKSPFDA